MCVAVRDQLVGLGVVEGQLLEVDLDAARLFDQAHARGDDVQVLQPEEVDLEQAYVADRLHVVLRDHGLAARAVLQRRVVDQWLGRDHDAGRMRADVARHAFERPGHVDHPLGLLARLVRLAELGHLFDRVLQGLGAALPDRHQLGQAVGVAERDLEHAAHVADGGLRRHGREGDDLGDAVRAVLLGHVADHALAALD